MSTAEAQAVQISLSGDNIDRYFRILEHYVLPLMVVSTIVLFCGYVASRIYHRTVTRSQNGRHHDAFGDDSAASPFDGTAAFLRELKTTPPIEDAEPKREPRVRAQHPLLRKRALNAAAALRARPAAPAPEERQTAAAAEAAVAASAFRFNLREKPGDPPPEPTPEPMPAPGVEMPPVADPSEMLVSETTPKFRKARMAASPPPGDDEVDEQTLPDPRDVRPPPARRRGGRDPLPDGGSVPHRHGEGRADRPDGREAEHARPVPPPGVSPPGWWQDTEEPASAEPAPAVVQPLKMAAPPSPLDIEGAKARAGEIVESLDSVASVLQQGAAMLAERMQVKQGLARDDVQGMRITGLELRQGAEEDLRALGGDIAEETVAALEALAKFDNVLRRLEQMAETEPLDEGWNDLLRTRISDTLYTVGQVRKALGGFRPATKKPAKPSDKHARPGGASGGGPDRPVPVGRRHL